MTRGTKPAAFAPPAPTLCQTCPALLPEQREASAALQVTGEKQHLHSWGNQLGFLSRGDLCRSPLSCTSRRTSHLGIGGSRN